MTRRFVRLLGRLAATILLALPAVGLARQASTRQLEALSPQAANRAVQADLLSILKPASRIESGMFPMLRGVGLTTQAHGTRFQGLCEREAVTLWYAPAEGAADGANAKDVPVRPYSVQSAPTFLFLSPPGPDGFVQADAPMVWSADCRAADKRGADWFPADDEFSAVQGALALQLAVQEIRAGRLKPEPCTLSDRTQTCAQAILAVGEVSRIERIETCTAKEGAFCYIIELPGLTRLTIIGRGDRRPAAPSSIQSIAVEEYIVVT